MAQSLASSNRGNPCWLRVTASVGVDNRSMQMKIGISQQSVFVMLVATAFWVWLAKDLVFVIIPVAVPMGRLALVCMTSLGLVLLSDRFRPVRLSRGDGKRTHSRKWALCFFCFCTLSGLSSGVTAFTLFKLTSLLISIVIACVLSEKVVQALVLDKKTFCAVGLGVAIAGVHSLYADINLGTYWGLRARAMGHLNLQDFYVCVWLFALTLLFGCAFSLSHVVMFGVATALCAPVVIAMNSRMIPVTVGVSLVYVILVFRRSLLHANTMVRNIVYLAIVVAAVAVGTQHLRQTDSRLSSAYRHGLTYAYEGDPRAISFRVAIDNFLGSPVLGVGFGKFEFPGFRVDPSDRTGGLWPHNLFLELLAEMGGPGFLLFLFFCVPILKHLGAAQVGDRGVSLAIPSVVCVYTVATMQLSHNISYPLLWLSLLLCDAASHHVSVPYRAMATRHVSQHQCDGIRDPNGTSMCLPMSRRPARTMPRV